MLETQDTVHPQAPPQVFSITDAAAARIAFLLSDEPPGTKFWVRVDGGGCSGFQYHFDLTPGNLCPADLLIQRGGASVAVDEVSLEFLQNAVLDYEEDLSSAGFVVKNPNATARCGCGNSFSVAL